MTAPTRNRPHFTLTAAQRARLEAWRAWWSESEDRYANWEVRDRDQQTASAIAELFARSGFPEGRDLTAPELNRLFSLARSLAPNPNLDARLFGGPEEPAELNRLLRQLLFGDQPLAERLTAFMERKGVGAQTASQLLCATHPDEYPLVHAGDLEALELTHAQREFALRDATQEYAGAAEASGAALRALAGFRVLEAVRQALGTQSYLEVHRILERGPREAADAVIVRDFAAHAAVMEERRPYVPADVGETDLLGLLELHIAQLGFTYPPLTIRNYYVALKTKPFAILSGASGIGKTRLTYLFSEALTGNVEQQYRLIPVRPDWTDSTALLGYRNLLAGPEGRYVTTRFLDFLAHAARPESSGRAYFLCLDEMNLARVEHYLSDLLSAMESPSREIPLEADSVVRLPSNLFLTGTVNVDETTHVFSRKVLDRANTIELTEVDLRFPPSQLGIEIRKPKAENPIAFQSLFLNSRVLDVAAANRKLETVAPGLVERALDLLTRLNGALAQSQLSFAYRVRDEALMYLANSFDARGRGLFDTDSRRNGQIALDFQVLQKVLPRLSGSLEQIEPALRAVLEVLAPGLIPARAPAPAPPRLSGADQPGPYPRSAAKALRLLARLERDGYATFYDG